MNSRIVIFDITLILILFNKIILFSTNKEEIIKIFEDELIMSTNITDNIIIRSS